MVDEAVLEVVRVQGTVGVDVDQTEWLTAFKYRSLGLNAPVIVAITSGPCFVACHFVLTGGYVGRSVMRVQIALGAKVL